MTSKFGYGLYIGAVATSLLLSNVAGCRIDREQEFYKTLYNLNRDSTTVVHTIPLDSNRGLAALVQLSGVDPGTPAGKAVILDAACNPQNRPALFTYSSTGEMQPFDPKMICDNPEQEFSRPGVKGGSRIIVRVPYTAENKE